MGGHCADFDEAKSKRWPEGDCFAVLIQACGQTNGSSEGQSTNLDGLKTTSSASEQSHEHGVCSRVGTERTQDETMGALSTH